MLRPAVLNELLPQLVDHAVEHRKRPAPLENPLWRFVVRRQLAETNLQGYIYITQLAVKQMLAQKTGGSVVAITSSLVDNPIGGLPVSLPMITKGGLEAITRSLASEYSKERIRFNAVAPGIVDTPLHKDNPKDFLKTLSPMGTISSAEDIASAVVYLTESRQITGEVLHVDGGAHNGKW